eukprot:g15509.t1
MGDHMQQRTSISQSPPVTGTSNTACAARGQGQVESLSYPQVDEQSLLHWDDHADIPPEQAADEASQKVEVAPGRGAGGGGGVSTAVVEQEEDEDAAGAALEMQEDGGTRVSLPIPVPGQRLDISAFRDCTGTGGEALFYPSSESEDEDEVGAEAGFVQECCDVDNADAGSRSGTGVGVEANPNAAGATSERSNHDASASSPHLGQSSASFHQPASRGVPAPPPPTEVTSLRDPDAYELNMDDAIDSGEELATE